MKPPSDGGDLSGLPGEEYPADGAPLAGGIKLSRTGRKLGRGGGEYVALRSMLGKEPLRRSSGSLTGLWRHEVHAAEPGGNSEVVLEGDRASVPLLFGFREPHANIAFARQLLVAFAKEAAVSDSLNFSA